MGRIQSYDAPLSNDEDSESLLEILRSSDGEKNSPDSFLAIDESLRFDMQRSISTLNNTERFVLEKHFGLNGSKEMSLSEIALEINYSSEGIRVIIRKALRQMRTQKKVNLLKNYLN